VSYVSGHAQMSLATWTQASNQRLCVVFFASLAIVFVVVCGVSERTQMVGWQMLENDLTQIGN
jgi:hypothetical protein